MRRRDVLRWMGMSALAGATARLPLWGDELSLAYCPTIRAKDIVRPGRGVGAACRSR